MKKVFSMLPVAACVAFTASAATPETHLANTTLSSMASARTGLLKKGEAKLRHKKHRVRHKHTSVAKLRRQQINVFVLQNLKAVL